MRLGVSLFGSWFITTGFFIGTLFDQRLLFWMCQLTMFLLWVNNFLLVRLKIVLVLGMLLTALVIVLMMTPRFMLEERLRKLIVTRMLDKILVKIVAMLLLTESRVSLILSLDIGFIIILWVIDLELLITLIVHVQLDEWFIFIMVLL
jgi:hypothetical protein